MYVSGGKRLRVDKRKVNTILGKVIRPHRLREKGERERERDRERKVREGEREGEKT